MAKGREPIHRAPFSTLHFRVQWNISNPFFSLFGETPHPPSPPRIERQSTRPVSACSCVRYHLIGWAFGHEGRRTYEKEEERIERFEHAPYSIRFRCVDAFDSFLFSRVSRHEQGVCALSLLFSRIIFFPFRRRTNDKLLFFLIPFLLSLFSWISIVSLEINLVCNFNRWKNKYNGLLGLGS